MSNEIQDIKDDMDSMKKDLHSITKQKQTSPVSALVWVPLVIWIVGATVTGIWWAATLTAQVASLTKVVETSSEDRYKATQANSDFELRDLRIEQIEDDVEELKEEFDEHVKECVPDGMKEVRRP